MADKSADTMTIGGHTVNLSNRDKVFFPESGTTKGDLVDYYRRIAGIALPHWRDRPLSMQRFPDGLKGGGFFQKDVPDYFPDWVDRVELDKEGGTVTYVLANNVATIVYLADQGVITPHLSLARRDRPDNPDRLIFDLDPSDDDFGKVQEAASIVRAALDELEMASFVQTTGSRGLHVVVPLDRSVAFDDARHFAKTLADLAADRNGALLTVAQRKNKRGDRVFLDYLRNAYGQTAVAPYAVRAIEGAPVATPLSWDEVGAHDLGPQKYTIGNIFRRLGQRKDPWADIGRHACSLKSAALKRLVDC